MGVPLTLMMTSKQAASTVTVATTTAANDAADSNFAVASSVAFGTRETVVKANILDCVVRTWKRVEHAWPQ